MKKCFHRLTGFTVPNYAYPIATVTITPNILMVIGIDITTKRLVMPPKCSKIVVVIDDEEKNTKTNSIVMNTILLMSLSSSSGWQL